MAKKHRVYCTYFPDGRYYIGYSCKTDKQFEKYFGTSRIVNEHLANEESINKAFKKFSQQFKKINIFINNASPKIKRINLVQRLSIKTI